jgi:hypothetical protein
MNSKFLFFFLLLVLIQPPSFVVEIGLEKFSYEPGESISIDVSIRNSTSTKECVQSIHITISDSHSLLCSLTNTYPIDTECLESGEEKVFTFSVLIPLHASEGAGTVRADVLTWSGITRSTENFFEIAVNFPPEITAISFPDVVNPGKEYTIEFSAFDNFGVEDIVSAEVALYYELKKPSERECYIFAWESPDTYTVWKGSPVIVEASFQLKEILWTLHFSLNEIAAPGRWTLDITVYDTDHQYHRVSEYFTVTKYLSFRLQDGTPTSEVRIDFGRASPGEEVPPVTLEILVTSNTYVNVFVQGDDLYSLEGWVLPVTIFRVESTGSTIQLDSSKQIICSHYAEKDGFSKAARIRLVFWGKLPEVMEAGAYSGIWYIGVEVG